MLVERGGREGWAVASGDGVTVALDLGLDDELVLEGEAYELIHRVNSLRKERGLELTDRIVLTVPDSQRERRRPARRVDRSARSSRPSSASRATS